MQISPQVLENMRKIMERQVEGQRADAQPTQRETGRVEGEVGEVERAPIDFVPQRPQRETPDQPVRRQAPQQTPQRRQAPAAFGREAMTLEELEADYMRARQAEPFRVPVESGETVDEARERIQRTGRSPQSVEIPEELPAWAESEEDYIRGIQEAADPNFVPVQREGLRQIDIDAEQSMEDVERQIEEMLPPDRRPVVEERPTREMPDARQALGRFYEGFRGTTPDAQARAMQRQADAAQMRNFREAGRYVPPARVEQSLENLLELSRRIAGRR